MECAKKYTFWNTVYHAYKFFASWIFIQQLEVWYTSSKYSPKIAIRRYTDAFFDKVHLERCKIQARDLGAFS